MVQCPHEDCRNSDREFHSDAHMRQHHTVIHGERLPNGKCPECEEKFFKKNSKRKYCTDCGKKRTQKGSNNPNYKGKVEYVEDLKERLTCSEEGCDESRSVALCFHHKPEYEKREKVSRMAVTGYGLEELKEEIHKCELICHKCHRERHANTNIDTEKRKRKKKRKKRLKVIRLTGIYIVRQIWKLMDIVSFEIRIQENAYLGTVNIAVKNFSHKPMITKTVEESFIHQDVLLNHETFLTT